MFAGGRWANSFRKALGGFDLAGRSLHAGTQAGGCGTLDGVVTNARGGVALKLHLQARAWSVT